MNDFIFKIAGEAGYGIASAGLIFARTAQRSGYFIFTSSEYPSLIRGGHNVFVARIAEEAIHSPKSEVDFLIALNQNAVDFHKKELSPGAVVILNSDKAVDSGFPSGVNILSIPLIKLAQENGGQDVMMNNVALGATVFLLEADFKILESAIRDVFSSAKPEIIDLNIKAARAGFDFAKHFAGSQTSGSLKAKKAAKKILISGNDAICLGAVAAGCKFFAAYPMTPINSMISYLSARAKKLGMVYFQPEDEIAGINSAIGASSAGLRSMVATSGGGFSLMTEAFGLAGMAEVPLVIIEGQRPGPSTGLPTWSGQGDLRFVLHASQDDFPRIILAPGDQEECFWLTIEAFNLADIYQTPVIILVDKFLCESQKSVVAFDESKVKINQGSLLSKEDQKKDYLRYQITESGISPRPVIGRPGQTFIFNSDEHDQAGFSEESSDNRKAMMEKRMRKLETCAREIPAPRIYSEKKAEGPEHSVRGIEISLVGWGSTKGVILEAQKTLADQGIETRFLHLNYLNPFPAEAVGSFLQNSKQILMIEQNITGQAAGLIREKTGIKIENLLLSYDGRPIYPEEIVQKVKEII
ncbi:MAG: 2-oxoacid:acceptor oxidoreductase subunit alpha [bacterium]|nr:2-oxoacid:acceptor oxidoreductase subunit alpha [bacterium]